MIYYLTQFRSILEVMNVLAIVISFLLVGALESNVIPSQVINVEAEDLNNGKLIFAQVVRKISSDFSWFNTFLTVMIIRTDLSPRR